MRPRRDLPGLVALVTGGASGIGLACARRLKAAGARVAIADASVKGLRALRRDFGASNLYEADVSDPAKARETVADLVRRRRRLDLLVLAAGICRDGVLWKMSDEAWDRVIAVDLSGAAHYLRAAAPALRRSPAGRVVLISSINGRRGKFGQANYAAAKAGLLGLARSAAKELAASGVTVNVVEPGFTDTPMTEGLPAARPRARRRRDPARPGGTPRGRRGGGGVLRGSRRRAHHRAGARGRRRAGDRSMSG